jgi:hypothetical protein
MRGRTIGDRQTFHVERGELVRWVALRDGRTYSHRCSLVSYEAVAHYIDERAAEGVTTAMLWEALPDVPCTQASVAAAFMKERGCLDVRGRRMFPESKSFFEDALIEFHALAAEPPDAARRAEAAQRQGDWSEAAAQWRDAAEGCGVDIARARYIQLAAWCDDMRQIVGEGGTP